MAYSCGLIAANIEKDCANKPVAGVKSLLTIINQEDIATVVYDATNPLIVTAMTLKTGKKAYTWEVYKRGHKPRFTQKDNDFAVMYQHELVTSVQDWDNATKAVVESLAYGYYVVIAENLQNTGDARFEIYGLESGLRSQDGSVRDLAANGGVYTTTLSNDSDMYESHIPASFAVTVSTAYSYTATAAAVAALLVTAS